MIGVMMMLGAVIFSVNDTTYDNLKKELNFRWARQDVVGTQPVYQYLGHGEKRITLNGFIYPGQYGNRDQLNILEQSAGLGIPMPLYTGGGFTLGAWCITKVDETDSRLMDTGDPQFITFSVSLVQYAGLADYLTELAGNYLKDQDWVQDALGFIT